MVDAIDTTRFQPKTLDKVERLLDLLEELGRHPVLKGKLCMHGGTAINVLLLDVPRLSVDIDLSYIGAVGKDQMLAERPTIENAIEDVTAFAGYTASGAKGSHAGRTFHLRYNGDWGFDQIKIDLIYLNRSPLMPTQIKSCMLRDTLSVRCFSDLELLGGKVKALYDRIAVRDIYDIANIKHFLDSFIAEYPDDAPLAHKIMLYHASISSHFPLPLQKRVRDRFSGREKELAAQLYPMLRDNDRPTLDALINAGEAFVQAYVLPRDSAEHEYLARLAEADYQPALLFADNSEVANAAQKSPEALWKLENLKKMAAG